jgi:hypothetical protein
LLAEREATLSVITQRQQSDARSRRGRSHPRKRKAARPHGIRRLRFKRWRSRGSP